MVLGIAVEALDGLVEDRPRLIGALGRGGAVAAQEQERGQAHRRGVLVEQRHLGALEGTVGLLAVERRELREGVEHLPTRLRLGAVQRVDQRVDVLLEQIGGRVRDGGDFEADLLATAAARAGEVLDQLGDQLGRVDGALGLRLRLRLGLGCGNGFGSLGCGLDRLGLRGISRSGIDLDDRLVCHVRPF